MTMAVEITEHFVHVREGSIYTKRWNPPGADGSVPLVLFHDSIGCVEMWRQFPLALSLRLGRSVVAYDRLGYGKSSSRRALPTINFVSEEAEHHIPALQSQLEIDRFVGFGHGVGGAMAVIGAARFPALCRAVITESAQAFVETRTLQAIADAKGL